MSQARPGEPALPVSCRPAEDHSRPTAASVTSVMPPATLAPLNFAGGGGESIRQASSGHKPDALAKGSARADVRLGAPRG